MYVIKRNNFHTLCS